MHSALDNPGPVQEYLDKEITAGRVVQVTGADKALLHTSKFGVIPKGNQAGKSRLILDQFSPAGTSVNDGIETDLSVIRYTTLMMRSKQL